MMRKLFLTGCVAATVMAGPATAQESRQMKISFVFSTGHWLWQQGGSIFAKKVEETTDGKVSFAPFPAGQLGKKTVGVVTSGIAEIGIVPPSYEADKMPLTSVAELPGMHGSACEGTAKLWNLAREGGVIYEKELKPLGLRALYANILPPYRVFTTKKKIEKLEDLAGLKLRANGVAMDKTSRALNIVPVNVPSTELFDSLTRGTVDGTMYPTVSVRMDDLHGILNHGVIGPKLGGGSTFFVIKESLWDSLDKPTQDALAQAGAETQKHLCEWLDAEDAAETEALRASGDIEFVTLSDEETGRWNEAVGAVVEQWEVDMTKAGHDGKALVEAYRNAPGTF